MNLLIPGEHDVSGRRKQLRQTVSSTARRVKAGFHDAGG